MTVIDRPLDLEHGWTGDAGWRQRLSADARSIAHYLPEDLRRLHAVVLERARAADASGLILSGSTARARRTEISDLDYHLVGPTIKVNDLSRALDLHVLSKDKLTEEILAGDDFVQWSLRFGLIVFDDGTLSHALRLIAEKQPWPDVARKYRHAAKSVEIACRFVETGDEDGALLQVRTAFSLAARAFLLGRGTFPLSRAELPEQLEAAGRGDAGRALRSTIDGSPSLAELATAAGEAAALIEFAIPPGCRHVREARAVLAPQRSHGRRALRQDSA